MLFCYRGSRSSSWGGEASQEFWWIRWTHQGTIHFIRLPLITACRPRGQMVVLCPRTVSLASIRPFRNALVGRCFSVPEDLGGHTSLASRVTNLKNGNLPLNHRKIHLQMVGFLSIARGLMEKVHWHNPDVLFYYKRPLLTYLFWYICARYFDYSR